MAIKITTNESILLKTKGCKCEEDVEIIVESNITPVWDKKISDYVEEMYFYVNNTYNNNTYTFSLPVDNITFNDLLLNYGTYESSMGGGYKYYGEGSYFLFALVESSAQLYDLHFGSGETPYGSSVGFGINTIITNNSNYYFNAGSGGGGSND